ncbi:hypothetical protein [Brachybacterium hainanense]|uniref:Uncharacterized protein n=1 Tax=Brachybacterium hainanense TaxID=1541174 RepID=A0ABV6RH99_9MICO
MTAVSAPVLLLIGVAILVAALMVLAATGRIPLGMEPPPARRRSPRPGPIAPRMPTSPPAESSDDPADRP